MSRMTPLVKAFLEHGRLAECPVIDMHNHPDHFHGIYFPDPDPEGIIRTMDRCGVTMLTIAPHAAMADCVTGNVFMMDMVRQHPDRFRGYWWYNPHYPEELDVAKEHTLNTPGIVGFKVHPSSHNYSLMGDAYQPVFAWANEHKMIVLSHTWNQRGVCDAASCRWVAERYSDMIFILGHSCYDDWGGAIALAQEFPNVYLELTAAERMPGFVDRAVREAGSHKMLFGTDLPWFNPQFTMGCILFADITDDDRHAIFHGNAERILGEHYTSFLANRDRRQTITAL
jgi:predicted TIM-barrel fold metal-dependent hydrolase